MRGFFNLFLHFVIKNSYFYSSHLTFTPAFSPKGNKRVKSAPYARSYFNNIRRIFYITPPSSAALPFFSRFFAARSSFGICSGAISSTAFVLPIRCAVS